MSSDLKREEKVPVSRFHDAVNGFVGEFSGIEELELKALERRVLRKTDLVVLPVVRNLIGLLKLG